MVNVRGERSRRASWRTSWQTLVAYVGGKCSPRRSKQNFASAQAFAKSVRFAKMGGGLASGSPRKLGVRQDVHHVRSEAFAQVNGRTSGVHGEPFLANVANVGI